MTNKNPHERVLVLAPIGRDAEAMAELLGDHKFETRVCRSPAACIAQLRHGAGSLVLTEEALTLEGAFNLLDLLREQPAWSELPLIILTNGGETRMTKLLESAARAAGTITLLERPIATTTLLRSVEVALRSRRRQYQVRQLLIEQDQNTEQLRDAHDRLSDYARELEHLVQLRTAKLAQSNKQLRRVIKEREEAQKVREELRRKLANAQEDERRRIARELHDQMGQNLTALNIGLRSLGDGKPTRGNLSALVRPLQQLAAETARDLHRVAVELRPSALDDLGLVKALRNLVEMWGRHAHIQCDFEPGDYHPAGVSPEVKITIYRAVQEALNNIAKHSGAKSVSVLLSRTPAQVQAIIEDNGRGFDVRAKLRAATNNGRLGLIGMKERLSNIGGQLRLESTPGQGTTLIIRIPLVRLK